MMQWTRLPMFKPIAVGLLLFGLADPAHAQTPPQAGGPNALKPGDVPTGFTLGDYGQRRRGKEEKDPALDQDPSIIRRQADRWPWLEPGTIVCRTQDDLERYRAAVAERLNGQVSTAPIGECRRLTRRTPIDIADRHGPATTEIHLYNDARQTAWTDVWLPKQRPN